MAIPMTLAQAKQNLVAQNRDYYNRKTWDTLLSQSTRAAETAEKQLVDQYTEASTEAYTSYLKNRSAIEGSNLYGDSKQNMLLENRINLEEAYNAYRQNLAKGQEEISEQYQSNISAIDTELTKEAQNYLDYENLHYDYLKELFENSPQLYNDPRFAHYITRDYEVNTETGEYEIDPETGEYLKKDPRVKTVDELYNDMYTYNKETDEYEMNQAAVDYYDMIENLALEDIQGARSWQSFLEETNPELAEWATSTDQYNYTTIGKKASSFKTMTGRESTDFAWSYAERMTGVKVEQLNEQFDSFKTKFEDTVKELKGDEGDLTKTKDNVTSISNMVKEVGGLLDDYGIKKSIEQQINMSFNEFADKLANAANNTSSTGGTVLETVAQVLGATAAGGLVGAVTGGPAAPITAVIGGITGMIAAVFTTKNNLDKQVKDVTSLNDSAKKAFDNMLVAIGKYAASEQQKSATSFKASKNSRLY